MTFFELEADLIAQSNNTYINYLKSNKQQPEQKIVFDIH